MTCRRFGVLGNTDYGANHQDRAVGFRFFLRGCSGHVFWNVFGKHDPLCIHPNHELFPCFRQYPDPFDCAFIPYLQAP
jgi:hypothetical protein